MADNCQYCGGRLKKLHPAHEVFCRENPGVPRLNRLAKAAAKASVHVSTLERRVILECLVPETMPEEPVTNLKTVTKNVTTPRLTRAEKAKLQRAKS